MARTGTLMMVLSQRHELESQEGEIRNTTLEVERSGRKSKTTGERSREAEPQ